MEPQQPHPTRPHPHLLNLISPFSSQPSLHQQQQQPPQRTSTTTPLSSPGLFSPTNPRAAMASPHPMSEGATPASSNSALLHPLHKVIETHTANVDRDFATGRKTINEYEVIEEIGRGQHGKVKRARDTKTGKMVAIKIIPRFSKSRRLGKVSAIDPLQNTKREIAILKKIRHENVVALLEVIDDPELRKIYMVLEHVERGEIVWRKKGLPHICKYERDRVEREMRGDRASSESEEWIRTLERKAAENERKRAHAKAKSSGSADYWSFETGGNAEDDAESRLRPSVDPSRQLAPQSAAQPASSELESSRATSRAPSMVRSVKSASRASTPQPSEPDVSPTPTRGSVEEDLETPVPVPMVPPATNAPYSSLEGTMYGPYVEDPTLRARSPSMADSIISHMSSVDFSAQAHDPFADDFSYVPCFTIDQARSTFRDTVLGLEYLHYHGVVHRDIKPANLLWTGDYRVKISDFGVSYFGRPIRDGEPDDTMSESEALDFDDDRELSKTVGTPAFFAPELCYTDIDTEPPKVSEQIDVWSLGVTLYCLIFARIPFLAEDEFSMFRKIATEEAYIPRRRLKPVAPVTDPTNSSLYKRINHEPYRSDDDLVYEDLDDSLIDLLRKMLVKNPEKRIRLRDVKRHRWVTHGITNLMGWIDDTDPSRRTSGRRIQVDDAEIVDAVVPLNFLQRAKSAVKRAVDKVMHPRGEREESVSRRRATSSANSSAGESPSNIPSTPYTPYHPSREARRKSLRGDDYFATVIQMPSEHPLTQSVTASPHESPLEAAFGNGTNGGGAAAEPARRRTPGAEQSARRTPEPTANTLGAIDWNMDGITDRPSPGPRLFRHGHARSVTNALLSSMHHPGLKESRTVPATPSLYIPGDGSFRRPRDAHSAVDDSSRARSMDRAGLVFPNPDKRAEPMVGLTTTNAPGNVQSPRYSRPLNPIDSSRHTDSPSLPSPYFFSSRAVAAYHQGQAKSESNMQERQRAILELEERPSTAHRVQERLEGKALPSCAHECVVPDPVLCRTCREGGEEGPANDNVDAARVPCPPSPDGTTSFFFKSREDLGPSREDSTFTTFSALSSSSASIAGMSPTPLTSPSEGANQSFIAESAPGSRGCTDPMLAFQSDPSLPALLSGASSVSADMEGDFLRDPGIVSQSALPETTDSLTPPALSKEPLGFPLEQHEELAEHLAEHQEWHNSLVPVKFARQTGRGTGSPHSFASSRMADEDDSDSDSDGGVLTMASKHRKKAPPKDAPAAHAAGRVAVARRRDTNTSIGSNETAKKVSVHGE